MPEDEQPNLPTRAQPPSEFLLYQTEDGRTSVQVRFAGETVWLSINEMADLFQRDKSNIAKHIRNVFDEGELSQGATVAKFATVQTEGDREVTREIDYFNLDVIISVGYRVHSHRGTQFRIWATQRLREYIIKGFTLDDERLKRAGGGNYFDELLARIRDIRSSEKLFWRKVLDIYASRSLSENPRGLRRLRFWPKARSTEEAMQRRASLTTRDTACGQKSRRPSGLRRQQAGCRVAAPRRCIPRHRLVPAPCIRPTAAATQPTWIHRQAPAIDYDPSIELTHEFFAAVQNKMHWAAHGHTAAEVIAARADATRPHMGLTTWTGAHPRKHDVAVAKNYLGPEELDTLNRIVTMYLDFAELQALNRRPMYMRDWVDKLDDFLRLSERDILTHPGPLTHDAALAKAHAEYDKFRALLAAQPTPVDRHFQEAVREVKQIQETPEAPEEGSRAPKRPRRRRP